MPVSFFAKTLRRKAYLAFLGAYPVCFVKWWVAFLVVVLVAFCLVLGALLCVFLFMVLFGYAGYGLVCFW